MTEDDEGADYYDDGWWVCTRCDGEGEILVCIDDLCRGAGECMHGDGMIACPACKGTGERAAPGQEGRDG